MVLERFFGGCVKGRGGWDSLEVGRLVSRVWVKFVVVWSMVLF